jgi:hypothetical protein
MAEPRLFDDDELEGKSLHYSKNMFFKKKKKITSSLIDICVIKSRIPIPLCKMANMETIDPILENDVALLSRSFSSGYIPIYASFFVSLEHKDNHTHDVTNEIQHSWDDVGLGK